MTDCASLVGGPQVSVRRGNSTTFTVTLKQNGTPIQNLGTAQKITFVLRHTTSGEFEVNEEWIPADPGNIVPDSPTTGSIVINLDSTAMSIPDGVYDMAVQVEWASNQKIEWALMSAVSVVMDLIP